MGYPLRNLELGQTHHVYTRCIDRKMYLKTRQMKRLLLSAIRKTQKKYNFELNGLTVMHNHVHFIITTIKGGDTLNYIMQYIKSIFAIKFNKLHNRSGPFWTGRYKDEVIEYIRKSEVYLNNLIIYLGLNPVKAQIVEKPEDYLWSTFNLYMQGKHDLPIEIKIHPMFDIEYVLNQLKNNYD